MHKKPTDLDKSKFIKQQFQEIAQALEELFKQVKKINTEFDYEVEKTHDMSVRYTGYLNGQRNTGIYMRRSPSNGEFAISVLYGKQLSMHSDNSANEIIYLQVTENNELELSLTMNFFGSSNPSTPQAIVQHFWDNHLQRDFQN